MSIKRLPTVLSASECERFFAAIASPRDRFLFRTMFYLGLRISETLGAMPEDFDLKEKVFTVRADYAKRKKERRVPIPTPFLPECKAYLTLNPPAEPLFDIGKCQCWRLCKKYSKAAGLEKNVHPHTLRHSYATTVYQSTGDLRLVQDLLGHANLSTTSIYTHLDDASRRKGIEGVFGTTK